MNLSFNYSLIKKQKRKGVRKLSKISIKIDLKLNKLNDFSNLLDNLGRK
jgi:hypothetical protein